MRDFEDLLGELFFYSYVTPPAVKKVNRDAEDIVAEVGRFKKERNQAQKKATKHKPVITTHITTKAPKDLFELVAMLAIGKQETVEHHVMDSDLACEEFIRWFDDCTPMPEEIQVKLEVSLDYSALSLWDQRHIKWQAAAQVLWFNKPEANVTNIRNEILKDQSLSKLLDLESLTSIYNPEGRGRCIEDAIREVNPVLEKKRGRPPKIRPTPASEIKLIPKIYNETKQINLKALRIAIMTLSNILKLQNKEDKEIVFHPIINTYRDLVTPQLSVAIDWWINRP